MNRKTDAEVAHWTEVHTVRSGRIGPPLSPSPEDVSAMEAAAAKWSTLADSPTTALLLGVTHEVVGMRWPARAQLFAFDHAVAAVTALLSRGPAPIPSAAITADWRRMPLPTASVAYALGDGSYNSVESTAAQHEVSRELLRVLKPGGGLALRMYVRPDTPETPARVFEDLQAGRIGWFTVFKVRLLMATPAAADGSIRLADTWELWNAQGVDRAALASTTGWPRVTIDTIDAYRDKPVRYVFHTLADTRALLAPYFTETALISKPYELGERCPTLLLKART
jgi:hypothetical protein